MTTEVEERECPTCEGVGTLNTAEHLDINSIEAVRKELLSVVSATGAYSLVSDSRANRVQVAARISWLASRLNWLEASEMCREEWKAKIADAGAEC